MRFALFLSLCAVSSAAIAGGGSVALSTKDLNDDIRASIVKEMSKAKQFKDDGSRPGGASEKSADSEDEGGAQHGSKKNNGCKMDVGTVDKPAPGTRRVVTVITGNVVQICK